MKTAAIVPTMLLLLAGCRGDPAAETPIAMMPGLYEVQLPGMSLAGVSVPGADTSASKKLCLRPGDGEYFAQRVVRESLVVEGCADPVNERVGNQLSTTIRCSIEREEEEASGDWYLRGRGRIDEDAFLSDFKIDLTEVEIKDAEVRSGAQAIQALQGVGSMRISARRVGDCPA